MIKNYFKTAWRNLWKSKGYAFLNIGGLAIGMAAAMLVLLWVQNEMGFDRFYKKQDLLYRVGNKGTLNNEMNVWFWTAQPLAPAIKEAFPEVANVTRAVEMNVFLLTAGEKKIMSTEGAFVDSSFLQLFDFPLLAGSADQALRHPTGIVVTESLARRLFGTTDVLDKTILLDSTDLFSVTGVLKDMPDNTQFRKCEYFLPWSYLQKLGPDDKDNWYNNSYLTFVELEPDANLEAVKSGFQTFTDRQPNASGEYVLEAVSDSWLYNKYENGVAVGGRIENVRIFMAIAGFILLIACINFMNLSTAQSEKRAKEVGIRKVVGAQRLLLIGQFLCEAILMAFIAGLLAIGIVMFCLPFYSQLVDRQLSIDVMNPTFWISFTVFTLLTGLLAGSYPAFILSSFQPVKVLKGAFKQVAGGISARKILVVTQFSIAVVLIVCTLIVQRQIRYGQDREVGYEKNRLIYVLEQGDIGKHASLIKRELIQQGIAASVTRTMSPLTENGQSTISFDWQGKPENSSTVFNRATADDRLVETAGLELIAGRDFDLSKYPTDSAAAILNQTAVTVMGFDHPIGQVVKDSGRDWHVIGVVKDFIQESPYEKVAPLVIEGAHGYLGTMHVKINPNLRTGDALAKMEQIFKKFNAAYPFEYKFVDEQYATKFAESQQIGMLTTLFAGLSIFISCLGLFGLAAFTAGNRTKEIGVRKVLGASAFSITKLLSKEFIVLVAIACLVAFPIAYWAMDKYLQSFSYRISIGWLTFVLSGLGAILITILTVSWQAIRAAVANPVDALRDE